MDIFEKTRELGEMIVQSEEMKIYKEAEKAQAEDEECQSIMREYNMTRMNLARDMQSGKLSREEAISKNTKAFEDVLEKSPKIKAFIDAKKNLDTMTNKINSILTYYITGEEPGCTHDCSSCAGCH